MGGLSELVRRAQQGDRAAYANLIQRFRRMVVTYYGSVVGSDSGLY